MRTESARKDPADKFPSPATMLATLLRRVQTVPRSFEQSFKFTAKFMRRTASFDSFQFNSSRVLHPMALNSKVERWSATRAVD